MFYFFSSIRKYFSEQWSYDGQAKPTNILQSTVGYEALMKIMVDILDKNDIKVFTDGCFDYYVDKIKGLDVENVLTFPMSTSGKKVFYDKMFIELFPNDPSVDIKKKELLDLQHNL